MMAADTAAVQSDEFYPNHPASARLTADRRFALSHSARRMDTASDAIFSVSGRNIREDRGSEFFVRESPIEKGTAMSIHNC
jgi:hypothetical protein